MGSGELSLVGSQVLKFVHFRATSDRQKEASHSWKMKRLSMQLSRSPNPPRFSLSEGASIDLLSNNPKERGLTFISTVFFVIGLLCSSRLGAEIMEEYGWISTFTPLGKTTGLCLPNDLFKIARVSCVISKIAVAHRLHLFADQTMESSRSGSSASELGHVERHRGRDHDLPRQSQQLCSRQRRHE